MEMEKNTIKIKFKIRKSCLHLEFPVLLHKSPAATFPPCAVQAVYIRLL